MKSKIFMYLFLFTALFVVFQYVNTKNIFDDEERKLNRLEKEVAVLKDSINALNEKNYDLQYFSFENHEDALAYFNALNVDELLRYLEDKVYEYNEVKGDNSLVPYAGMNGEMKINKVKILNHKWMITDFSDGKFWGELLLKYSYDNKTREVTIERIDELLYSSQ